MILVILEQKSSMSTKNWYTCMCRCPRDNTEIPLPNNFSLLQKVQGLGLYPETPWTENVNTKYAYLPHVNTLAINKWLVFLLYFIVIFWLLYHKSHKRVVRGMCWKKKNISLFILFIYLRIVHVETRS